MNYLLAFQFLVTFLFIFADSNINIQMNYWFAEMTNMNVTVPLFDYIEVSCIYISSLRTPFLAGLTTSRKTGHREVGRQPKSSTIFLAAG